MQYDLYMIVAIKKSSVLISFIILFYILMQLW